MTDMWFDDVAVIGHMPLEEQLELLSQLGEESPQAETAADSLRRTGGSRRLWRNATHLFGFVDVEQTGVVASPLVDARVVSPDQGLKGKAVKVALDYLQIADYPGYGTHSILFDFYGRNQLTHGGTEDVHFTMKLQAPDNSAVPVVGLPIFVGLNVGDEGVCFKCITVNIRNERDEHFLSFLESDEFRKGLKLLERAQPALVPLSQMAYSITLRILRRNRNTAVQNFYLGLDFSNISTRARLRPGTYLAIQMPKEDVKDWRWDKWVFNKRNGQLTNTVTSEIVPYNIVGFSISPIL